jgi:proline dehydrogenase
MGLARTLLLRASRSQWLADQFRKRPFARRAVRRFMPGEKLSDALDASAKFASGGIGTVLTELGEQVRSGAEAQAVRDHYLDVFSQLRERFLPTQLSVKLTHLGLDLGREACARHVLQLAARATEEGSFLWLDMEEARYVDPTLDIFRRVRAEHNSVGVCIQAYLRRTPADLATLLPLSPAIRLVKGAYREPAEVAFTSKEDVDAQFFTLADELLASTAAGRAHAVFGTHDMALISRIREQATKRRATGRYEVHMLYGIRAEDQRALAAEGVKVRVLVSYGSHWFAWYMRRLAERPANVWFVVRTLF